MADYSNPIDVLISIIGGGVYFFIPLLVALMVGLFVFNFIQKKTQWKWMGSAIATVFILWFVVFVFIHFTSILAAAGQTDYHLIPEPIRNDPSFAGTTDSVLGLLLQSIVQAILSSAIFTLISMPFIFLGLVTFSLTEKRFTSIWARLAVTIGVWSLILAALVYFFPWILAGLIYLGFFGL
ncbi:MAG: hypothetical protein IPJ89_03550 [Candidatus Iainarchaeum archaeon]|uniref:Uncharacterized protein n=1 Tax=Candidatus Iainarchaeum sp. TaxID=3101447 RepID=A0A7T9I1M9_9ARCH|nr:MAG: hypothetical protein IPJ89_03550 [Candidatus Diapherotrites archaeon]